MIPRIVLGTTNPGKLAEWSLILKSIINLHKLDLSSLPAPVETGQTFADNAAQKANYYARLTGEYVLADDGGYEIDVLDGWPGVKSRRILPGEKQGSDQDLINQVLDNLKSVPPDKRIVRLTAAVAIADPQGKIIYEDQESFAGVVTDKPGPVLIPGYPFRSIHWIPALGKTYAELTEAEHRRFNHKYKLARRLAHFLQRQSL